MKVSGCSSSNRSRAAKSLRTTTEVGVEPADDQRSSTYQAGRASVPFRFTPWCDAGDPVDVVEVHGRRRLERVGDGVARLVDLDVVRARDLQHRDQAVAAVVRARGDSAPRSRSSAMVAAMSSQMS